MTRVTVDLDELACVTAQDCIDNLMRQADFLDFCMTQSLPDDEEAWGWPQKLRDAADGIKKTIYEARS